MTDDLTVEELRDFLDGIDGDEPVSVVRGGALGEARKVYRNVEGVVISGR